MGREKIEDPSETLLLRPEARRSPIPEVGRISEVASWMSGFPGPDGLSGARRADRAHVVMGGSRFHSGGMVDFRRSTIGCEGDSLGGGWARTALRAGSAPIKWFTWRGLFRSGMAGSSG
jgi:hypothetical protein